MINPTDLAACVEAIWKANANNVAECAEQSMAAFPPPPIMANLEIMSNNQFSKLLADTQKRAFVLGALAMATAIEQSRKAAIQ